MGSLYSLKSSVFLGDGDTARIGHDSNNGELSSRDCAHVGSSIWDPKATSRFYICV